MGCLRVWISDLNIALIRFGISRNTWWTMDKKPIPAPWKSCYWVKIFIRGCVYRIYVSVPGVFDNANHSLRNSCKQCKSWAICIYAECDDNIECNMHIYTQNWMTTLSEAFMHRGDDIEWGIHPYRWWHWVRHSYAQVTKLNEAFTHSGDNIEWGMHSSYTQVMTLSILMSKAFIVYTHRRLNLSEAFLPILRYSCLSLV